MTAKKKRILRITVAALMLIIGVVTAVLYSSSLKHDPLVSGRRLSSWLSQLVMSGDAAEHAEAVGAIRSMGTNALFPLLAELQAKESLKLWETRQRLKDKLEALSVDYPIIPNYQLGPDMYDRRWRAQEGLIALGGTSAELHLAIPKLTELMLNPDDTNILSDFAAMVLISIQPEGYALIRPALTNQDGYVRAQGACMAARAGTQAPPLIPKLVEMLTDDPFPYARMCAATSLGVLGLEPDLVIPALIKSLPDENTMANSAKAQALLKFGPSVQPYLPLIRTAMGSEKLNSSGRFYLEKILTNSVARAPVLTE